MGNKRSSIPLKTQKLIFQEAGSMCAFCGMDDIHALEIHHINSREDGGGDEPENLILVCSNCHSQITFGIISMADVVTKKRELIYSKPRKRAPSAQSNVVNIRGAVNNSVVANVVKISKTKKSVNRYPEGSVGADTIKKNYLDYLIHRYYECRKADSSFGAFTHAANFHHSEIHTSIRKRFKAKTFFVPIHRFHEECQYIQGRIDKTILGKRYRSGGKRIYQNFDEYLREQSGAPDELG